MKTVIAIMLLISTQALAEQKCTVGETRALFLAGAYIAHQATTNEDFRQGSPITGNFKKDVGSSLDEMKVQLQENCRYYIYQDQNWCGWQVFVDGNKNEVMETWSGYFCERQD
jgi:hypothetical protein